MRTLILVGLVFFCLASKASAQIFWGESGDGGKIRRTNLDGLGIVDVVTGIGYLRGMAIDASAGKAYWTVNGGNLSTANLDGSGRRVIATTGATPSSIALDRTNQRLYWLEYDDDRIERVNVDGTGRTTILTLPTGTNPLSVVVNERDQQLFWTEWRNGGARVRRANLDGSDVREVLIGGNLGYATTLQLDLLNDRMYWTNTQGLIGRASLDGSAQETVLSGLSIPHGLALDPLRDRMYWTEYFTGTINRSTLGGMNVQTLTSGTPHGALDELAIIVPEPLSGVLLSVTALIGARSRPNRDSRRGPSCELQN